MKGTNLKHGVFTCVGLQVALLDPIWQAAVRFHVERHVHIFMRNSSYCC